MHMLTEIIRFSNNLERPGPGGNWGTFNDIYIVHKMLTVSWL